MTLMASKKKPKRRKKTEYINSIIAYVPGYLSPSEEERLEEERKKV